LHWINDVWELGNFFPTFLFHPISEIVLVHFLINNFLIAGKPNCNCFTKCLVAMAADVHIEMKASKSIQKGKNNKLNVTIIPKQQLISRNYLLSVHPDCKMPSKQKKSSK